METRVERGHWLYARQVAHRGLHNAEHPENTMSAFVRAIEMGYAIETDIQLTLDGKLAVIHDGDLSRATGGRDRRHVSALTMRELQELAVFGSEETVPELIDLLKLVDGRVPLLIELKAGFSAGDSLAAAAARVLDGYAGPYAVQSFNPYVLLWYKRNRPAVLRGQLSSFFAGGRDPQFFERVLLKRMFFNRRTRPDFISYNVDDLPNRYVAKYVAKHPVPVLAWTVHCPHSLEQARAAGCDNIIFEGFIPPREERSIDAR